MSTPADEGSGRLVDLTALAAVLRDFAAARGWERFHTPKNLAMALSVEVAELVEPFQWLTAEESAEVGADPQRRAAVADEIADVLIYLTRLADVLGVDVDTAVRTKLTRNRERFPPGTGAAEGS